MAEIVLALSFDDVLLVPRHSKVTPKQADTSVKLDDIVLKIPIMSAPMDTVTELRLAIALAREGGIGIIHKNFTIEEQAELVWSTKKSESFVITDLFTLPPQAKLSQADKIMKEHNISGIPIIYKRKIIGIITSRDIRFLDSKDFGLPVQDFMTRKVITAPPNISLEQAKRILHRERIEKLPIVGKRGELIGMITSEDIEKSVRFPNACKDGKGRLRVGAAVGVSKDTLKRCQALINADVDMLVIDSSHGHSEGVLSTVRRVKDKYPDIFLIGGNVATGEGALALIEAGVDCVKVGVGPGSTCTTRWVNGSGVPQLTAIMDCYQATKAKGIPLIADGGIRGSGDIVKALAAGADLVMIGNLFARTEEAPGDIVYLDGKPCKRYRGMGSLEAMRRGSKDRYFQSDEPETSKLVPEGIEGVVPYGGRLADRVYQLMGGVRSGMGINGAMTIPDLQAKAKFVRITQSGLIESFPHDMIPTAQAPSIQMHIGKGGVR